MVKGRTDPSENKKMLAHQKISITMTIKSASPISQDNPSTVQNKFATATNALQRSMFSADKGNIHLKITNGVLV